MGKLQHNQTKMQNASFVTSILVENLEVRKSTSTICNSFKICITPDIGKPFLKLGGAGGGWAASGDGQRHILS